MTLINRNTVRILLLNKDKLLLMLIQDFDISTPDGKKNKQFWCTVGGKVEDGESIPQAALREIHEETGLTPELIKFGPIVWMNETELILKGVPTKFNEGFIVANTSKENVSLHMPTADEKSCVKQLSWFTIEQIKNSKDIIFPAGLAELLTPIIEESYPNKPIKIN